MKYDMGCLADQVPFADLFGYLNDGDMLCCVVLCVLF